MVVNKTNFAKALQKYYLHKSNKIVFCNQMSLNQLSLAMWERLGFREMDPSILSRVINGKRLFTKKQLQVFCKVLKIRQKDRILLNETLLMETYKKFKLIPYSHNFDIFAEVIEDLIEKISEFRLAGNPHLASELTDILLQETKMVIPNAAYSKQTAKFFDYYARLLLEAYYNKSVFIPRKKMLIHQLPLIQEIKELAKNTKRRDHIGLYYFTKGGAYYDQEQYDLSLPEIKSSLGFIKWPSVKLEATRQKILSLAHLNLTNEFDSSLDGLEELTHAKKVKLGDELALMDGVGRAQGLLKRTEAIDTLSKVEKIYFDDKCQEIYRLIQLIRSQMEVANRIQPKDKNYFEKIGNRGLKLANQHGYKRYATKLKEMLNSVL